MKTLLYVVRPCFRLSLPTVPDRAPHPLHAASCAMDFETNSSKSVAASSPKTGADSRSRLL
jgi:hypothetical protein